MPSPLEPDLPLGQMSAKDWERTLELMKSYQDITTDMTADTFFTNQFIAN